MTGKWIPPHHFQVFSIRCLKVIRQAPTNNMTRGSETPGVIGAIHANAQLARTTGYKKHDAINNAFFIFLLLFFSTAWLRHYSGPRPENCRETVQLSGHISPASASGL
jgi:hypothetical protein